MIECRGASGKALAKRCFRFGQESTEDGGLKLSIVSEDDLPLESLP